VPVGRHVVATDGSVIEGAVGFDELLSHTSVPIVEVEPDALAVLIFTSGTAGSPRAAMLTHGNLRSNIDQSRTAVVGVQSDDVVYGVLPLNHIFGLNVVLGLSLARGATVVLVNRFDPATALGTIRGTASLWSRRPAGVDCVVPVRRGSGRLVRQCGWRSPAAKMPEDAMRRRAALRAAAERGLRAHRGVADRDELGRAADQTRLDRQGARWHGGAARR
jgi:hypothetical protein